MQIRSQWPGEEICKSRSSGQGRGYANQASELQALSSPSSSSPQELLDSVFSTLEVTELATGAQRSPDIIGSLITHHPWFNLWPGTYFLTQINDKQVP